jgi:hypothetical protein
VIRPNLRKRSFQNLRGEVAYYNPCGPIRVGRICFPQLLRHPLGRRMGGEVEMNAPTSIVSQNKRMSSIPARFMLRHCGADHGTAGLGHARSQAL